MNVNKLWIFSTMLILSLFVQMANCNAKSGEAKKSSNFSSENSIQSIAITPSSATQMPPFYSVKKVASKTCPKRCHPGKAWVIMCIPGFKF
jgi:hypothetical protein